jgi:hypothetical protein
MSRRRYKGVRYLEIKFRKIRRRWRRGTKHWRFSREALVMGLGYWR